VIIKFWLNVSKEEQRKRLLDRINEPEGNWKFNASDIKVHLERQDNLEVLEVKIELPEATK